MIPVLARSRVAHFFIRLTRIRKIGDKAIENDLEKAADERLVEIPG